MKRFYNNEKMTLEKYSNYDEYVFEFKEERLGLLDDRIHKYVSGIQDNNLPILFVLEFDKKGFTDIDYIQAVINLFIGALLTNENHTGREMRLAVPKDFQYIQLGELVKRSMINKKSKFPIFRVEVKGMEEIM